jgi:glycosyltransferase involved in cell wall biosynthesis
MRVALDATPLTLSTGGLRRYTGELSRALAEEFPADEFLLACDRPFPLPSNLAALPTPRGVFERRWWSWGLNRVLARERIDLFHGTNFEVPYWPARPSVLTLHDLSPWKEAVRPPLSRRVRSRAPLLIRLGIATMLIAPTEAVRREASARFRIHPDRIVAVPEAASAAFRRVEVSPAAPYFLHVGAAAPRKNVETIVEAWREVRKHHAVDLVLEGDTFVTDERLAELYSGALAFLYPSLYEGFGLPLVEAMQCGAPVIASCDPAVMEVCGGAAVHADARDTRAWVEAMIAAIERPEWLADLRARSLERARDFSWPRTARRTREVYEEARRRFAA